MASRGDGMIESALRGPAPAPTAAPPDGTAASGYVTPDLGPFECENCTKFQEPSTCTDPHVVNDPEVNGQVDPEGCCNYFTSAHKESQEQEHTEGLGGNNGGSE
jgi:hypothetical protein